MRKRVFSILLAMMITCSLFVFSIPVYAIGESGTVAVGWGTTFYITKDGTLYGYGKNDKNLIPGGADYVEEPVQILSDAKSVSANRYAVLVVKRDGSLWYWGRIDGLTAAQPTKLRENVVTVAIEAYYSSVVLIVDTDGVLYQLNKTEFQQIRHTQKVKSIAVGGSTRFFINESDELWGWSSDKDGVGSGALGVGHGEPVLSPVKIMDDVQSVASYSGNTMIIRRDSTLFMCGSGVNGKLYTADGIVNGPVMSPVKVMDNVLQAAIYDARMVVVKRDHTMWVWGTNVLGTDTNQPTQAATDVAYAVIGGHLAAMKTDNSLWTGGSKAGVYHAEKSTDNPLRLTAEQLQDAPASWALAEVREAEYRKLVPPAMQSDYTKIVTRSEFCTLAITCIEQSQQMTIEEYLVSQGLSVADSSPFTDIGSLSERARKDIQAAYALKIVNGTSATTFDPLKQITREQAAKMLTATAAALGKNTEAQFPQFADAQKVSVWAKHYIGYVFDAKIMSGVGNNNFSPQGGYQRQQAYMTMLRLYKQVAAAD